MFAGLLSVFRGVGELQGSFTMSISCVLCFNNQQGVSKGSRGIQWELGFQVLYGDFRKLTVQIVSTGRISEKMLEGL